MICTVDKNGYCAAHGRVHKGEELMWCLSDTPYGEEFREWLGPPKTKPPSLLTQAATLATAVVQHAAAGFPAAENQPQRLAICMGCEFFQAPRCLKCGCNVRVKAAMGLEKCPVGKW